MIYGIGHDVLEIARITGLMNRNAGKRFAARVLTPQEQALADEKAGREAEFIAGRFAAKEAVVKALGCGIGETVGFQDIGIMPDPLGKPLVSLSPEAWERLGLRHGEYTVHLTITHGRELASAFAVVERIAELKGV
ncbi:holo-ACP synthase [Paenibacillus sp. NFR01]|uniref:holo-ACP synthase n=1 Tax=Paenibacillus sp. NFR01 TaxID=1566279 RepID=UPI000B868BE3|nr:holo-ACP synthase [Paenibacillus sp. NFR01]